MVATSLDGAFEREEARFQPRTWKDVAAIVGEGSVIPVVYMNSDARIRAFLGRRGGTICSSSSNASAAFHRRFDPVLN